LTKAHITSSSYYSSPAQTEFPLNSKKHTSFPSEVIDVVDALLTEIALRSCQPLSVPHHFVGRSLLCTFKFTIYVIEFCGCKEALHACAFHMYLKVPFCNDCCGLLCRVCIYMQTCVCKWLCRYIHIHSCRLCSLSL